MRYARQISGLFLVVFFAAAAALAKPQAASPNTVACRVMEAGASARFGVRLVIFHYRDSADRERLGRLLRQFDGAIVQFQAGSGGWRTATVLRLKTCFGRGLLVFSGSERALTRGDVFLIRFAARRGGP